MSVRFLQNNLADADVATAVASSAVSGYPSSNALDERRWKRWRTGGAFTVVAGTNDKVYVADGGNQTATLTAGTYATPALFAAHVQTQLNAVSSVWTCTWSSTTGKFTLGRAAGTATLRLTQTTAAAWSTLGFIGALDVSAGTGLAGDVRRNHTSETFTVDLGSSRQCRAFAMLGASGIAFPISSTATLRLRGSDTNNLTSPWLTYDEQITVTRTDDMALAFFDKTLRYWQAEWIDPTDPNGPNTEIAQVYLGDYVEPASRDVNIGFERVLIDPSSRAESEAGVLYHRERNRYWVYSGLVLDQTSDSDREEVERVMTELGRTVPFFIALDPEAAVSSSITEFTKYVVFDDDPARSHIMYTRYGLSFTLREVIG